MTAAWRWLAASAIWGIVVAMVLILPWAIAALLVLPWPWTVPNRLLAGLVTLGLSAAWPLAASGWVLAVRERWLLRLVAVGVTWALLLPSPAYWGVIALLNGRGIVWLSEPLGDKTVRIRKQCTWSSWEAEYDCDARGYEQHGWWPRQTFVGHISWSDPKEAGCCRPELVRREGELIYRVGGRRPQELRFGAR